MIKLTRKAINRQKEIAATFEGSQHPEHIKQRTIALAKAEAFEAVLSYQYGIKSLLLLEAGTII